MFIYATALFELEIESPLIAGAEGSGAIMGRGCESP